MSGSYGFDSHSRHDESRVLRFDSEGFPLSPKNGCHNVVTNESDLPANLLKSGAGEKGRTPDLLISKQPCREAQSLILPSDSVACKNGRDSHRKTHQEDLQEP